MKSRINGQGHHPKVRVYVPRVKFGVRIRKIILSVSSTRWLTIIRRGDDLDAIICNHLESELWNVNEKSLLEPIVEEMGCPDSGTWYVDTDGCGMLQVNEANPPPKHGFLHKAMHYAASVLIIALMAFLGACQKDPTPQPQPDNPNDTIVTPPEPVKKNDTIFVNWATSYSFGPSPDTVRNHLNRPDVDRVVIHMFNENGIGGSMNCAHFSPGVFHAAREDLQQDIDVDSTRTSLYAIFEVNNINAPNHEWGQDPGITPYDKAWFESKGVQFIVLNKKNSK